MYLYVYKESNSVGHVAIQSETKVNVLNHNVLEIEIPKEEIPTQPEYDKEKYNIALMITLEKQLQPDGIEKYHLWWELRTKATLFEEVQTLRTMNNLYAQQSEVTSKDLLTTTEQAVDLEYRITNIELKL